ncbi:acyltransferase family protein [Nocardioides sp. AN3]
MSSPSRITALDGLRGIAVGLVVLRHFVPPLLPNAGVVGVQIFFVLSGFLITGLLLGERQRTGQISIANFYIRRAVRLLPALYAMLAAYLVAVGFGLGDALGTSLGKAAAGAALSIGYVFNFGASAGWAPVELGPLWTLSVEEQFYFLWPVALIFVLARGCGHRLTLGLGFVIVATWVVRPFMWALLGGRIYFLPTTWIDPLVLGALIAIVRHQGGGRRVREALSRTWVQVACWVVVAACAAAPELKSSGIGYTALLPIMTVAMGALVWTAVDAADLPLSRLLTWSPLVWLGWISYSLYLWNFLVREVVMATVSSNPLVAMAVGMPGTLLIAWSSRAFVEEWALRYKDRLQRPRRREAEPLHV